jgi:phosphoglycerate dehydrogenase-like enzyme
MKIAVSSPSFSKHPVLIKTIQEAFENVKLNTEGRVFSSAEFIEFAKDSDAIIVGLDQVTKDVIDALPSLKFISKYGVGLDNIDLEYCRQKNIEIGWTGGVNRLSVAEMCLGNMLSLIRNISPSSKLLASGIWEKQGGEQLSGKRVGIIGLGYIGKELVRLLQPFHCEIWVNDLVYDENYIRENELVICEKEDIYKSCKVISIHLPLTSETKKLISEKELSLMQDYTILINSSRGEIVDQSSLHNELKTGRISAALDVFEVEPPTNLEFLGFTNLISTPHIGGNAKEAVEAMGISAIKHLKNFIS